MAGIYDVNAAIQKPDLWGSFQQGRMQGAQMQRNALAMQQAQQSMQDQNALRQLGPQVLAGDPAAYQQAAVINPEAAAGYMSAGDAPLRKLKNMVGYIDQAKASGNQNAVNAALQQAWPYIRQVVPQAPEQPPTSFTPEMDAGWEQLKAKVAGLGVEATGTAEMQNFNAMTASFTPDQIQQARMVQAGLRPRAGNPSVFNAGAAGVFTIDPQTGAGTPVMLGGGQAPQAPQKLSDEQIAQQANAMIAQGMPEAQVESWIVQQQSAPAYTQQGQQLQVQKETPQITPYQQAQLDMGRERLTASTEARQEAAEAKQFAQQAKADAKQQEAQRRQDVAAASATDLMTAIDTLMQSPGYSGLGTTSGDLQTMIPLVRNDVKDSDAQLRNISGQVALATMNNLRTLSAQGATGFGALSQGELTLLQNSISNLQGENISNEELTRSLKVVRDKMSKIANWRPSGGGQAQPTSPTSTGDYSNLWN